jgi:hypothetical protein
MADQAGLWRIGFAFSGVVAIIAVVAAFTWTGLIWLVVRIIS